MKIADLKLSNVKKSSVRRFLKLRKNALKNQRMLDIEDPAKTLDGHEDNGPRADTARFRKSNH